MRPSPHREAQAPPAAGQIGSTWQYGVHASPTTSLPSSHGSEPFFVPSLQTVRTQAWPGVGQAQPLPPVSWPSSLQDKSQPSLAAVLPSSHCSGPTRSPSPQRVGRQTPPATQVQPSSTWQVAEQPSPPFLLPSSHSSLPVSLRSPHTMVDVQAWPGFGQT